MARSRHRKDGAPRKLVARSRHRKDGAPRKLVAQQGGLGTGEMVRLGNLWLKKGGQSTGKMMRLGKERWCA